MATGDGLIRTSTEKTAIQNADWNPDDHPMVKIVQAQYQASPYEQGPASPQPRPDANGRWRQTYGPDGFKAGTPDGGGVTWKPDRGGPAQPGDQPQPPADPGGFSIPSRAAGGERDPNKNGDAPTGPVWSVPGQPKPGSTQVAEKPKPIKPDDFWKAEDVVVQATATQVGHRTNDPLMIGVAGATMGTFGDWTSRFLSARADNILERGQEKAQSLVLQGRERPVPTMPELWAKDWQRNFDPHARINLQYEVERSGLNQTLVELKTQEEKLKAVSSDLGATMAAKQEPSEKVVSWLAEHNEGLAKQGKPAVPIVDVDKTIAKTLTETQVAIEDVADKKARNLLTTTRTWDRLEDSARRFGGRGLVRGFGAVGTALVVNDYADRLITGNNEHAGLETPLGAISVPLAAAIKPSDWFKSRLNPEGKGSGFADVAATAAMAVGLYAVGNYADKFLPAGTKDALASPAFNMNAADIGFIGITAGMPSSTFKARGGLALSGWLEGRSLGAESLGWKVADTAAAIGVTMLTVPKSGWLPAGILHGIAATASFGNWALEATGHDKIGWFGLVEVQHPEHFQEWAQDGFTALKDDMTKKSGSSLNDAADKWAYFAKRDTKDHDGALFKIWDDWTNQGKPFPPADDGGELMRYRGGAILGTALGETRLENGTGRKEDHFHMNYIPGLEHLDLDIGGDAAMYLEHSKRQADLAIAETQRLAKLQNKAVDPAEIAGLNEIKARDDKGLDRIYNQQHDVATAIDKLKDYWLNHGEDAQKNLTYINGRITKLTNNPNFENDPVARRLVAKMAQDKYIMLLARASQLLDASTAGQPQAVAILQGAGESTQLVDLLSYANANLQTDKDVPRLLQASRETYARAGQMQVDVDAMFNIDVWNTGAYKRSQ